MLRAFCDTPLMAMPAEKIPTFHRTGVPGMHRVVVDGQKIATIYQRDDRSFWYADPDFRLGVNLDIYAPTFGEVKEAIIVQVSKHTGRSIWHCA